MVDHSSLGLYYALLGRPLATIPVPARLVNPAAPLPVLRSAAPVADPHHPGELAGVLDAARARHDPRAAARVRSVVTSYPGQAAARSRVVLYRTLGLRAESEVWSAARSVSVSQPSSPVAAPTR